MKISGRGLTGSIIIHALILALLILGAFEYPDPPPEEEGILVNFGIDETGYGQIEPMGDDQNEGITDPVVEEAIPEPVTPASTPVETTPVDNTQDVEEVIVKEDPKPTAEELRKQREEAARIQREKDEAEAQRIAELERQRIERERIEQEEKERKEREEKANRLNKLGQNTFGQQGVGSGSGSQGVTQGSGNQGTTTGTAGAPNYGEGGGLGDGISYGLGGRGINGSIPKPNVDNCNITSRVVVTVEIQVDKSGNVVSARVSKATFADKCIWDTVIAAAKKTKFTSDSGAPFKQTGWIKYTIEP